MTKSAGSKTCDLTKSRLLSITEADFMALLHIPLNQIDEGRLQALITSGAVESRTIDYKRTTYGIAHADYSEFLADASSFANTSGGDLVLGIDATNGIPTAVTPLPMQMDPEILRLDVEPQHLVLG
jgi:hypothetical protein